MLEAKGMIFGLNALAGVRSIRTNQIVYHVPEGEVVLMPLRAFGLFGHTQQRKASGHVEYVLMPLRAFGLFGRYIN